MRVTGSGFHSEVGEPRLQSLHGDRSATRVAVDQASGNAQPMCSFEVRVDTKHPLGALRRVDPTTFRDVELAEAQRSVEQL